LFVGRIFQASPLMALALCISLGTVLWCILLARRQRNGLDKVLTGLLGLIAIYEALRILADAGMAMFPAFRKLEGWADFVIATLALIAALILRVSSIDRATTKAQLRLVEANEKAVDLAKGAAVPVELRPSIFDASPLAAYAVDLHGIVTYWNAAAESLTGWSKDEVIGHALPFSIQGPITNKTGNEVEAVFWTSRTQAANGTAGGWLAIAADSPALHAAGRSRSLGTPVAS